MQLPRRPGAYRLVAPALAWRPRGKRLGVCLWVAGRGFKGYKGKRPQSRRLTASLFINVKLRRKKVCLFGPGIQPPVKGREGKGYIAVPACGGSLAEAKRACNQTSPN
eukprot:1139082-Pelagomonas_calceolata.AAC.4